MNPGETRPFRYEYDTEKKEKRLTATQIARIEKNWSDRFGTGTLKILTNTAIPDTDHKFAEEGVFTRI